MTLLRTDRSADTDAPILELYRHRWSTRIFDTEATLPDEHLATALEAARWSPSAGNAQPWRFLIGPRGGEVHARLYAALDGSNPAWAGDAAVLVGVVAVRESEEGRRLRWAEYDAGQAAAALTTQLHALGYRTHQMGGFDVEAVRAAFALPERLEPITIIAAGPAGDPGLADAGILARETGPRSRLPLDELLLARG